MNHPDRAGLGTLRTGILLTLFFVSGAAALIYEVLWLKELGRLFGVTAQAAATTLAVFFLGLSAGGLVWGRRAARLRNPLRAYAFLEVGIAASALLYFALLDLYRWVTAPLLQSVGYHPAAVLLVKFALSLGVLFLPAFFMGGTLPVMAQFLVRRAEQIGRTASALYALNTIGAAVGAFMAGFYLPRFLGFRNAYFVAIGLNAGIALVTYLWSTRLSGREVAASGAPRPELRGADAGESTKEGTQPGAARAGAGPVRPALIWTVACLSGFVTLGLEVLWTRMFAQVLQNSVYTFAAILTVFLAALAAGSALAHYLCRRAWPPRLVLPGLLFLSGVLVGLTPAVFYRYTEGMATLEGGHGWGAYIVSVFGGVAVVLLVPTIVMGSVFPYLMKLSERRGASPGRIVGQLAAANTIAAIAGSLLAGFVLLGSLGLWGSIRLMAILYLLLALLVIPPRSRAAGPLRAIAAGAILLFGFVLTYDDFSVTWLDPGQSEELVEVWEGSAGTVAVVRRNGDDLRIKVNTTYPLGGSGAAVTQRLQAQIPLALHRDPRAVFFLGMGTGISAGAALDFPLSRVVVCELNPDIIRASRKHFRPFVNGLFDDPRVEILHEDGRTYLSVSPEQYDLVIADIFLTYKAGVGSLYTLEHFETVSSRLAPGGAFVQWLTMFDLSTTDFGIIARTMLEVFPEVTLWRRSVSPRFPVYALIGRNEPSTLDRELLARNLADLEGKGAIPERTWLANIPLAAYVGNLSAAAFLFEEYPLSTDDRTPLEYLTPITERSIKRSGEVLAWEPLARFCERIMQAAPAREDPYLAGVDRRELDQIQAGLAYYRHVVYRRSNDPQAAQSYLREYRRLLAGGSDPAKP